MVKLFLSLDAFLLLLIVPFHVALHQEGTYLMVVWGTYVLVVVTLGYLCLEVVYPLASISSWADLSRLGRITFLLRQTMLWLLVLVAGVLPAVQNIIFRRQPNANFNEVYLQLHDGAYQTELALALLQQGRNPYSASYATTPLAAYQLPETEGNPAVDHYIYLPGLLWLSWPLKSLSQALWGWFDQRLVYILFYLLTLLLLPLLFRSPQLKLAAFVAIGLNPLLTAEIHTGMNDVTVLFFLVVAILFLERQRWLAAAIMVGLACSCKQSGWLAIPFYVMIGSGRKHFWQNLLLIGLVMAIFIGPLALWDFPAFWDDTFAYASGTAVGLNYPIRGYSFGRLLVGFGIIPTVDSHFPFWLLQLLGGGLALAWLLPRIGRATHFWLYSALFIFILGFFSRFFNHTYFGFVTLLATTGWLMAADEQSP